MGTAEAKTRLQFDADDEVLTLNEAAKFLKVSERTLWSLAKEGLVPCRRVGKQYRMSRNVLVRWIQEGNGSLGPANLEKLNPIVRTAGTRSQSDDETGQNEGES